MHPKHSAVRVIMILRETIILNNKSARQMLTEHKRLRYCSRTKSFFKVLMFCMTCAWLSGPRSYMHKRICLDACFKQLKLRCSRDISPIFLIKPRHGPGVESPTSRGHARTNTLAWHFNQLNWACHTDRQTDRQALTVEWKVSSLFATCHVQSHKVRICRDIKTMQFYFILSRWQALNKNAPREQVALHLRSHALSLPVILEMKRSWCQHPIPSHLMTSAK